jgi:hypothetical protein
MLAVACALGLQRRRDGLAAVLAVLTPLGSPVAALFAALAAVTAAVARGRGVRVGGGGAPHGRSHVARAALPPLLIAAATLVPVLVLAWLFPEGGHEPYAASTLWPILVTVAVALVALRNRELPLRIGILLFGLGNLAAYLLVTPVGSNASRLEPLLAGPLAAILWWSHRRRLLLAVALPLLYIQVQAPIRDVSTAWHDEATQSHYYQPLLSFLARQGGPPFRIEIPFTLFHWEAYEVAPRFPLARGWERQLDIKYNGLFYSGRLTAARYDAWLHRLAVRFVAVPEVRLDYSARQEEALIDRGLPYLRPVASLVHWRIYAVADPTPIAQGAGRLIDLAADSFTLRASRPGRTLVRVRFTPYWAIADGSGCVRPDGEFTAVTLDRAGDVRIVTRFSASRIEARSPRCTP